MTTNPSAKVVLCYGDSNTYGQMPDKLQRYPANVRWTGQLQNILGDDYYVIEEGLGGRTTDLDYTRKLGRNGKTYLMPCLQSHKPFDVVVIMLGTNDLKIEYARTAEQVAAACSGLIDDVQQYSGDANGQPPHIVLVSPILIDDTAPNFAASYTDYYDARAVEESRKLAGVMHAVAEQQACAFIDAASVACAGDEGVHWDEPSHGRFAKELAAKVRQLS